MKEAFRTWALKLGTEEWEEFEHVEMSKKVIEGTRRARYRGDKSLVQGMVSGLLGTGSHREVKENNHI